MPLQGATAPTRDTQGVASLALGYVLHWAFSPHLLNPKVESFNLLTLSPPNPQKCQQNQKQYTYVQSVAWTRPNGWGGARRVVRGTP